MSEFGDTQFLLNLLLKQISGHHLGRKSEHLGCKKYPWQLGGTKCASKKGLSKKPLTSFLDLFDFVWNYPADFVSKIGRTQASSQKSGRRILWSRKCATWDKRDDLIVIQNRIRRRLVLFPIFFRARMTNLSNLEFSVLQFYGHMLPNILHTSWFILTVNTVV